MARRSNLRSRSDAIASDLVTGASVVPDDRFVASPRSIPARLRGVPAGTGHRREIETLVAQWGRDPVSPFLIEPGNVLVRVPDGATGYRIVRNWAVFATDPASPPGFESEALDRLLAHVAGSGRRATFAAVADPRAYIVRGMYSMTIADDARIDLAQFSLAGTRMANVRHSVTSARRAGLRVVPYDDAVALGVERVSSEWLTMKRGGELGFTLGTFDRTCMSTVDGRVALDERDQVVGFVTWRAFDDGRGRVLDMMRRAHDAPNPTMDLLVAEGLLEHAAAGVEVASLGVVPRSRGPLVERVYPTAPLRRYKEKFAPTWTPLSLVAPSRFRAAGALRAVANAYCGGALTRAFRDNG